MLPQPVPVFGEALLVRRFAIDEQVRRALLRAFCATFVVQDARGHQHIHGRDTLHDELEIRSVVEDDLVIGHEQAQGIRHEREAVILGYHACRLNACFPQSPQPSAHGVVSDNHDGKVASGAPGSRCKVQVFDFVGDLLFERERQRRAQSRTPGRQVAGERRGLAGGHEHDDFAAAHILYRLIQRPGHGRCPARPCVVDRDPARGGILVGAKPNHQKFCHRHVVPRLRRIGTTCPVAPRCNVLK